MKKYIAFIILSTITIIITYLSSVYLVRAELSLKRLAQTKDESDIIEFPLEIEIEKKESFQANTKDKSNKHEFPKDVIRLLPEKKPEKIPPEEKPKGPATISMEFEKANLKDVLKIFCQQSGLNFIAGENIELKPVTLYLSNVSVDDALDAIIKANGLTYERAPSSDVFIVRKSGAPELKLETKIFKLKYALSDDRTVTGIDDKPLTLKGIKESIKKLLTTNGDLSVDERTNSLIITDIPSRFPLVENAINDLDMKLPQILIEAKIVELSTGDIERTGIKWSSLAGYTMRLRDPTRQYLSERWGGQDKTDVRELTSIDSQTEELSWDEIAGRTVSDTIYYTIADRDTRTVTDSLTRHLLKSDIRSAILSADDFELTLSLLLTDTNVDIISSPNIVTSHGKEARITIGEEFPIPKFAYNEDTATFEVQGFDYKDIGIILRVTPYATKEEETITMEIYPEVSSISGSVVFRGIEIPIISTRQARTNVSINDGDTLAIGGLLRDRDDSTITKVPVLGDIPVLGRLFRHKEASKTKTNMIIFITPHLIKDERQFSAINPSVTISAPVIPPAEKEEAKKDIPENREGMKEEEGKYQFTHR